MERKSTALDLALAACRKRQSPRTGFVHLFWEDDQARDTIPIYENFCFSLALLRQKSTEAVLEGRELLERLLAFQTPEGNFPVFLHDYPRAWDRLLPLKIAPVLLHARSLSCLGEGALLEKLQRALSLALECAERGRFAWDSLWEMRFRACHGEGSAPFFPTIPQEWFEWLVSAQLLSEVETIFPYSTALQAFIGDCDIQERGEPQPHPLEWLLAEEEGLKGRLILDHPHQIYLALLFPVKKRTHPQSEAPFLFLPRREKGFRFLWKGATLHSICSPSGRGGMEVLFFDLFEIPETGRGDLVEVALYCDISSETELFVSGKKATLFRFGDRVEIATPSLRLGLEFSLDKGEGEFCGQISQGNRPGQISCRGALLHEAFDWRIALRTLRRSSPCRIKLKISILDGSRNGALHSAALQRSTIDC